MARILTPPLSQEEKRAFFKDFPQWQIASDEKSVSRVFDFRNFREAFAFMTEIALIAEKKDHHPEWRNVYKTVEMRLITHDCDDLSALDAILAAAADKAYARFARS